MLATTWPVHNTQDPGCPSASNSRLHHSLAASSLPLLHFLWAGNGVPCCTSASNMHTLSVDMLPNAAGPGHKAASTAAPQRLVTPSHITGHITSLPYSLASIRCATVHASVVNSTMSLVCT